MGIFDSISRLLNDRIRLISALAGFVTGFSLFFDASMLLGILAVSLIYSIGFLSLTYSVQSLYKNRSLKSFIGFLIAFLFVFGILGGLVYTQFQYLPINQTTLKYNTVTGECEEVQVGGGDKPVWYYSEYDEEKLREYCERQVDRGVEANVSICLKHPGGFGS